MGTFWDFVEAICANSMLAKLHLLILEAIGNMVPVSVIENRLLSLKRIYSDPFALCTLILRIKRAFIWVLTI